MVFVVPKTMKWLVVFLVDVKDDSSGGGEGSGVGRGGCLWGDAFSAKVEMVGHKRTQPTICV